MKLTAICVAILLSASLHFTPAFAVDDIGVFEMDGNAVEELAGYEDWETLHAGGANNGGTPLVFTDVIHDHGGSSIFEGGRKDIMDINFWRWKTGSVPDKDDITHAYAAAYRCAGDIPPEGEPGWGEECSEGDVVAYFGADRFSNSGDAFLGFWFFKDAVSLNDDGSFDGIHLEGDILVLVNFPQGSNASPEIRAVEWSPACSKADKDPIPGDCVAKNLRLVYEGVVCGTVASDDACAITNTELAFPNSGNSMLAGTVEAPWDYTAKTPDPNCEYPYCLPYESLFEGGVNLSRILGPGADTCFASFMVESRSSSSFTATLKDFVLRKFPLCAVELSKECGTGIYNPHTQTLSVPYSVTVENTGSATVNEVIATDDECGAGARELNFGPIAAGESETLRGTCEIAPDDFLLPLINRVYATTDSSDVPVFLADSCATGPDPDSCYDACSYDLSPDIEVTKDCYTRLTEDSGLVAVEVFFYGTVQNTSDEGAAPVPLANVQMTDDMLEGLVLLNDCEAVPTLLGTSIWLEPGEMACFEGSYLPGHTNSDCPGLASFMDTATATAETAFTGGAVADAATAKCDLCDPASCP